MLQFKSKTYLTLLVLMLAFAFPLATRAACSNVPVGGDYTVGADCAFGGEVNGVDGGNLIVASGTTLTINANQTVVWGTSSSITIEGAGAIAKNETSNAQYKQTNIWYYDADGDGYAPTTTPAAQNSQPTNGKLRRNFSNFTYANNFTFDYEDSSGSVYPGTDCGMGRNCDVNADDGSCAPASASCISDCTWCDGSNKSQQNVSSGNICSSGSTKAVDSTDYCNYDESCNAGDVSATKWYTACDGAGSCRSAGVHTDSHSANVYADQSYTLTSTCGTQGTTLCGYSGYNGCNGDCQKKRDEYRSDGSGSCNYDVGNDYANVSANTICSGGSEVSGICGYSGWNGCNGDCQKKRDEYACNGSNSCSYDTGNDYTNVSYGNYCSGGNEYSGMCNSSSHCNGADACSGYTCDGSNNCDAHYSCSTCNTTGSCECSGGSCDGPWGYGSSQINGSWDRNCDGSITEHYAVYAGSCPWYPDVDDASDCTTHLQSGVGCGGYDSNACTGDITYVEIRGYYQMVCELGGMYQECK